MGVKYIIASNYLINTSEYLLTTFDLDRQPSPPAPETSILAEVSTWLEREYQTHCHLILKVHESYFYILTSLFTCPPTPTCYCFDTHIDHTLINSNLLSEIAAVVQSALVHVGVSWGVRV